MEFLSVFLIADDSPEPCRCGKRTEIGELWKQIGEIAPSEIKCANGFDEMSEWVELCQHLCPLRHTHDGCQQTAHQDEYDQEEEHYEGCLPDGRGVVGYDKS